MRGTPSHQPEQSASHRSTTPWHPAGFPTGRASIEMDQRQGPVSELL